MTMIPSPLKWMLDDLLEGIKYSFEFHEYLRTLTMPNTIKNIKGKWHVVESKTGKVTKNQAGTAVDGGGHVSRLSAQRQAQAININQAKK